LSVFVIERFMEAGRKFGVGVNKIEDLPRLQAAFEAHSKFDSAKKCEAWYDYLLDMVEGEYNIDTSAETVKDS